MSPQLAVSAPMIPPAMKLDVVPLTTRDMQSCGFSMGSLSENALDMASQGLEAGSPTPVMSVKNANLGVKHKLTSEMRFHRLNTGTVCESGDNDVAFRP